MMTISPGASCGREKLTDELREDRAIHRLIDDEGGEDAVRGKPGDERRHFPMSVGCVALDPLAAWGAAIATHHIGGGSGLIDEDEPPVAQRALSLMPVLSRERDVRPELLGGVHGFF